jgi:hypothetical protein
MNPKTSSSPKATDVAVTAFWLLAVEKQVPLTDIRPLIYPIFLNPPPRDELLKVSRMAVRDCRR